MASQNYFLLALLWSAYCVVHSVLISLTVTGFFRRALGNHYRFYRLFFNVFSLGTLLLLLQYSDSSPGKKELLFSWEGLRLLQYGMIALGAILLLTGARHYSLFQFLGIKQIWEGRSGGAMTATGEFDSSGVLGVVRHPWYVGWFLLIWAGDITLRGLMINMILSSYLVVGTFLEERKLVLEFGERYKEYQRQVSMFVPIKWLKSKLQG